MRSTDDEVTDPALDPRPAEAVEDALSLVLRAPSPRRFPGAEREGAPVLEVHQLWRDLLVDTKHFGPGDRHVTIGSILGWRWRLLGVDLGSVPSGLHLLARLAPPLLSDVDQEWRSDFHSDEVDEHALFEVVDDACVACVDARWKGFARVGGEDVPLDQLAGRGLAARSGDGWRVPIRGDLRLYVEIGEVAFVAGLVRPGDRVVQPPPQDHAFLGITSAVMTLGLMFAALTWLAPEPVQSRAVQIPDRFVQLVLQTPPEPPPVTRPIPKPSDGGGERAAGDEGRSGRSDAKMKEAKGDRATLDRRRHDRELVANSGILGVLGDSSDPSGVWGSGIDASISDAIGGLTGPRGTRIGNGGIGDRGPGPGGGGDAEGTSFSAGPRGPGGPGPGIGGLEKQDGVLGTTAEPPLIIGSLPRSLIDEVVKSHLQAIRYCYQRQLQRSPELAGKVVVRFVIAGDGSVSSATLGSSTLDHQAAEDCVVGRFMRMQFPKPRGGGIVVVTYPLLFAPSR